MELETGDRDHTIAERLEMLPRLDRERDLKREKERTC